MNWTGQSYPRMTKKINKISNLILNSSRFRKLAVHRVITTIGSRSPGFSDKIPYSYQDQNTLVEKLGEIVKNPKSYKANPLDIIYIDKADGTPRPISIPSYIDRSLQALYSFILDVYCEGQSDKNSYGFRPLRNQHFAIRRIQFALNTPKANFKFALEIDIKKCFDTISHQWLLKNIPMNKHILSQWLKCGYIERTSKNFHQTVEGTPQGSLISPILCNMTLNGLEDEIRRRLKHQIGNRLIEKEISYSILIRYADDMVFLDRTESVTNMALEIIENFLEHRSLKIKKEKTRIVNLSIDNYNKSPINFLGCAFKCIKKGNQQFFISTPFQEKLV